MRETLLLSFHSQRETHSLIGRFWDGRGVGVGMATCICVAESLPCSPGTTTTLLISYTLVQNKKFEKKIIVATVNSVTAGTFLVV